MAFNAFKMMMAAAGTSFTPPPFVSNEYYADQPTILNDTVNSILGFQRNLLISGSSTTAYSIFNNASGSLYASEITTTSGGPSVSVGPSLSITTQTPQAFPAGDSIDSTHFGAMWLDSSGFMNASYVTNSSGTLTKTNTYTSSTNTGGPNFAKATSYMTLDGTHAILAASGVSARPVELINPTLGSGQLIASTTGTWTIGQPIYGVSLSNSLAVVAWTDSSNIIQISTIDITGGTSITAHTAVSSSTTIYSNSGIGICKVNPTTILLVYPTSATVFAARTVIIGAGGSVTYNTQVTQSASFARQTFWQPVNFGVNQYITGWITNDLANSNKNGGVYLLSMLISGNTVTLGTQMQLIQNSLVTHLGGANPNGGMAALSNNKMLMSYNENNAAVGANPFVNSNFIMRLLPFETELMPSWSTTWSGNGNVGSITVSINNGGSAYSIMASCPDLVFVGGQNIDSFDLDYNKYYNNNNASLSAVAGSVAINSTNQVDNTNSCQVIATAYINGSGILVANTTEIGGLDGGGSNSFSNGTASNIDSSPLFSSISSLNLSPTSNIVIFSKSTGIYASIVTTNNNSIASVTTPVQIYSTSISSTCYIASALISSTSIAVVFHPNRAGTAYLQILSISGGVITFGTPVALPTSAKTSSSLSICFLSGNYGIVTYIDAAGSNMQAVPYSFSGTTVTLGTKSAFTTSGTIKSLDSANGMLEAVDVNNAIVMFYDTTGTHIYATMLSTSNGSTVIAGTNYSITTSIASSGIDYLSLTSAGSGKLVAIAGNFNTTTANMISLYRS